MDETQITVLHERLRRMRANLSSIYERYKKARIEGFEESPVVQLVPASAAAKRARYEEDWFSRPHPDIDWEYPHASFDASLRAEVKSGIFTHRIRLLYDNDYGPDEFGKVHEVSRKPSYSDRPDRWVVWVEAACQNSYIKGWYEPSTSYAEHIKYNIKGFSKRDADLIARYYIHREARFYEKCYRQDLYKVGYEITTFVNDVEIGGDSLWGFWVKSNDDPELIREIQSALESLECTKEARLAVTKEIQDCGATLGQLLDTLDKFGCGKRPTKETISGLIKALRNEAERKADSYKNEGMRVAAVRAAEVLTYIVEGLGRKYGTERTENKAKEG